MLFRSPKPVLAVLEGNAWFGEWRVRLSKEQPKDGVSYPIRLPERTALTVTPWRRADRMMMPDSRGERSLKRLFNDAGVRPWRRDTTPVFRIGDAPAAAPGVGVDKAFAPEENTDCVYITFYNEAPDSSEKK